MEHKKPSKQRQERFLAFTKALNLEFPVKDIAEKTGYAEPTVSEYLNSKRDVSGKFFLRFCEVYGFSQVKPSDLPKVNAKILPTGDSYAEWAESLSMKQQLEWLYNDRSEMRKELDYLKKKLG